MRAGRPRSRPPSTHAESASAPGSDGSSEATRRLCLVPRSLPDNARTGLIRRLAAEEIEVLAERRRGERRRRSDQRRGDGEPADGADRRRITSGDGRRVGDRRVATEPFHGPELPSALAAHSERLNFVRVAPGGWQRIAELEHSWLALRAQAGEPGAFARLFAHASPRVFSYARVTLRDWHEAEDATQEIFLRLLSSLDRFDATRGPFAVWLSRITRNHLLNVRARSRPAYVPDPLRAGGEPGEPVRAWAAIEGGAVLDGELLAAINGLPESQRQVIALRYLMDLSWRQVAELNRGSEAAARQLHQRAIRSLRQEMVPVSDAPAGQACPLREQPPLVFEHPDSGPLPARSG